MLVKLPTYINSPADGTGAETNKSLVSPGLPLTSTVSETVKPVASIIKGSSTFGKSTNDLT